MNSIKNPNLRQLGQLSWNDGFLIRQKKDPDGWNHHEQFKESVHPSGGPAKLKRRLFKTFKRRKNDPDRWNHHKQ